MFSYPCPACLLVLLGALSAAPASAVEPPYSILHSFQEAESNPQAALISDGVLYGTTAHGGPSDGGTVFKINTDGTGFHRLHTFAGGSEGFGPGSLILDGFGSLYGLTAGDGVSNAGTVFTIKVDGTDFQVLHRFVAGGGGPSETLTLDGLGNLYGTTIGNGVSNAGTVFTIKVDGTDFQVLHTFEGGANDGNEPNGPLILDESGYLYGTTVSGGHSFVVLQFYGPYDGAGTIFRIRTDGTGFQLLRTFSLLDVNGAFPSGSLTSDGSGNLYGLTASGGSSNFGTVFRIGMDGSGFQILHSFAGGARDGAGPFASLALDRSGNLYGITDGSGGVGLRTIFRVRADATGYQLLRTFVDASDAPWDSLILDGSETLYGATMYGGSSNAGTLFSIDTQGNLFQVLYSFAGFKSDGSEPSALISDGSGHLYGTTVNGGSAQGGTVFRIRSDGTGFQLLHAFSRNASDAFEPNAPLMEDGRGNLYGTTNGGWPLTGGTIFRLGTDGTGFQILHTFIGGADDGSGPISGLILDGVGNLYGTTNRGGSFGAGTVFRMKIDGTGFQLLKAFSSSSSGDGDWPERSLVLDRSGNLYGTTPAGGSSDAGTVFKVRTDGTGFQVLHSFVGGASDGRFPYASLILDELGNLYGTTSLGGHSAVPTALPGQMYDGSGTVFKIKTDGTGFVILRAFTNATNDAATPYGPLILDGSGNLYGTTTEGGSSNYGTVFRIGMDGSGFQILHSFAGGVSDGKGPVASLVLDQSGNLIGTTPFGGMSNFGTVFSLFIGRHDPVITPGPLGPVRRR